MAALVIPFLVIAFVILYVFPQETERLFAWKIQRSMSAMMLGAAYVGGIYFFTGVLLLRHWHRIRIGLLPVITFASLLGIATILHWDRFNHDHISFAAWAGLYFTTPAIVLIVWLGNRHQDSGQPDSREIAIPSPVRLSAGVVGVITLAVSLFLFLAPEVMIGVWPWSLTPLTVRVLGAMFALPGVVGLGIAIETRWSAAKHILQSQSFSILLILLAVIQARRDFDWTRPGSWLFAGGLGVMLAGIVALFLAMQVSQRAQAK